MNRGPTPTEHRDQLLSDLKTLYDFISNSTNLDLHQISYRKKNIVELWDDFQGVQSKLEAEDEENIDCHMRYRREFEELYVNALTLSDVKMGLKLINGVGSGRYEQEPNRAGSSTPNPSSEMEES